MADVCDEIVATLRDSVTAERELLNAITSGLACVCEASKAQHNVLQQGLSKTRDIEHAVPKSVGEGAGGGTATRAGSEELEKHAAKVSMAMGILGAAAEGAGVAVGLMAGQAIAYAANIRRDAEAANERNRSLMIYSPQMMAQAIQENLGEMMRRFDMAQAIAPSAVALSQSVERMQESWKGFDIFVQRTRNDFAKWDADVSTIVGHIMSQSVGWMQNALNSVMGTGGMPAMLDWLQGMTGGVRNLFGAGAANAFSDTIAEWRRLIGEGGGRVAPPLNTTLWGLTGAGMRRAMRGGGRGG
jgi:hypothetical protein